MAGIARLCDMCASAANKCIKCGAYIGSGGAMAHLCDSCASGANKWCIKCGAYIG